MDVACAALVIATLKGMTAKILSGEWKLPNRAMLIGDYNATVQQGRKAAVDAPHVKSWLGRLGQDFCRRCGADVPPISPTR